jgi:hypothetical protein
LKDWTEARRRLDEAIKLMDIEAVRDVALSLGRMASNQDPCKVNHIQ